MSRNELFFVQFFPVSFSLLSSFSQSQNRRGENNNDDTTLPFQPDLVYRGIYLNIQYTGENVKLYFLNLGTSSQITSFFPSTHATPPPQMTQVINAANTVPKHCFFLQYGSPDRRTI